MPASRTYADVNAAVGGYLRRHFLSRAEVIRILRGPSFDGASFKDYRGEQRGVAIEIDGDPARQDLDHTLAARGLEAGCLFALDSDAHTPNQLSYAETAVAHARLAGIQSTGS
jgi:hypothetical protein